MQKVNVDLHARVQQIKRARTEVNRTVLIRLLLGILMVLGILARALALASCAPSICDPSVSFVQTSNAPMLFDAYLNRVRIATNVTFDAIRACTER